MLTPEYWFDIRKKTRVADSIGAGWCKYWAQDVLLVPEISRNFRKCFALLDIVQIEESAPTALIHVWLESLKYIDWVADGTAGQYDEKYSDGYYGLKQNAPVILQRIWAKKIARLPFK